MSPVPAGRGDAETLLICAIPMNTGTPAAYPRRARGGTVVDIRIAVQQHQDSETRWATVLALSLGPFRPLSSPLRLPSRLIHQDFAFGPVAEWSTWTFAPRGLVYSKAGLGASFRSATSSVHVRIADGYDPRA
jgi:hypothetical protein